LAKRLTYDSSLATDHSALTLSGAVMGTPHYMAPEQAQGKVKQLSTGADVYSLGAILYQMLTGRPPFEAETPLEVMRKAIEEEPERPNAVLAPSRREVPLAKSQI
jgi:serine/threonine protein kinase